MNEHHFDRLISSVFLNFANNYIMLDRIDLSSREIDLVSSILESFDHVAEFVFHFFLHEIKLLIAQFKLLQQSSTDFCFVVFRIEIEIDKNFILIAQTKSLHNQLNVVVVSANIDSSSTFSR